MKNEKSKPKFKYKVWVNNCGTKNCTTKKEVDALIGKCKFGELYEVRYYTTNKLVEELMPY